MAALTAVAAYPQSAVTPPAGDPEVFYIYLRQVHRAAVELGQTRSVNQPEALKGVERRITTRLKLSVGAVSALDSIYESSAAALGALNAEGRTYTEAMRKKGEAPAAVTLQGYYSRRLQIIQQATQEVRSALGETNWLALWAYIDGEFRRSVRRRRL